MKLWIILLISFVFLTVFFLFLLYFLKSVRKREIYKMKEKFPDSRKITLVDYNANFFGEEKKGMWQIRGNGILLLTENVIWFSLFLSDYEILIPVKDVLQVKIVKSHLGKSILRDLLYVKFISNYGENGVAWYVKNPEMWMDRINVLREKGQGKAFFV